MYDYYRVRFKKLIPRRRGIPEVNPDSKHLESLAKLENHQVSREDLKQAEFISLYTAWGVGAVGAVLGPILVTWYLGRSDGFGMNDIVALVGAAVVLAGSFGCVGLYLGERLARRKL